MNKKAVLVLVIFVLFVASVVSGKLYWNKKIANATGQTQTSEVTKTKAEVKDSGAKKEEKKKRKNKIRSHLLMKHMRRICQMQ